MAKSGKPADDSRKRKPAEVEQPKKRKAARPADDEDEDEEEDDAPTKPRKVRKRAVSPVRLISYIVGGVIGAVLLIFLMVWVYSPVGADPKLLCYCPPETFSVEGMDFGEMGKNSELKDINSRAVQRFKAFNNEQRFNANCGITEKDVEYYMNCQASGDWEKEKDYEPQDRRGSLTMLRMKTPIDQSKFLDSYNDTSYFKKEEKTSRDGKKYYQLYRMINKGGHEEPLYDVSFFLPDNRTLIIASTRKELEEALNRTPGKIELDQTMSDLVNNVDGHYFKTMKSITILNSALDTYRAPSVMSAGFAGDLADPTKRINISLGSANWIASDGNYFLIADGMLMVDRSMARESYANFNKSVQAMRMEIYQNGKKAGENENPFFVKQTPGAPGGGGGEDSKKKEDIADALTDYYRSSTVGRHGNMVYIEGRIFHEKWNKMWTHIADKVLPLPQQGGGFGMPGMPGR